MIDCGFRVVVVIGTFQKAGDFIPRHVFIPAIQTPVCSTHSEERLSLRSAVCGIVQG